MTHDEMIAVIQAHKEGKPIQYSQGKGWNDCGGEPMWNFYDTKYRIKPEPHYRPFKNAEEVMEAIKEHGDWVMVEKGDYRRIEVVETSDITGEVFVTLYDWEDTDTVVALADKWKFADGTPFGVKEE